MSIYVGITIGPIFDTISEASFPAALWFGSTLFSDMTRRICKEILNLEYEEDVRKVRLISPAYDSADDRGLLEGIGKYHDRIIFSVEYNSTQNPEVKISQWLDEMIKKIKEDTLQIFPFDDTRVAVFDKNQEKVYGSFLEQYLQIQYCMLDSEVIGQKNCILVLSPYLDALECMKTFPKDNASNPINLIMKNASTYPNDQPEDRGKRDRGKSEFIKHSQLFKNIKVHDNQLIKESDSGKRGKDIWDIPEIASGAIVSNTQSDRELKYKNYFATVTADADSMTKFLNSLNPDKTTLFSERCLEYSKMAAKEIGAFGGMTIYAGGDDLLFLAPVLQNMDGTITTVFELCKMLADTFKEIMERGGEFKEDIPTISFGIAIRYKKYPLYESLETSRELLELAKKKFHKEPSETEKERKALKNSMAISLQKHSGQQCGLVIYNPFIEEANSFILKAYNHLHNEKEEKDKQSALRKIILGLGYKIENQYALINAMDEVGVLRNSWENLFDNEGQKAAEEYVKEISEFYYNKLRPDSTLIASMVDDKTKERYDYHNEKLNSLLALMRMARFFVEKNDEKEESDDGMVSAKV